jgi:hypothetical protein
VDYTEHIIRNVVTRGLADHDIQLDLLGDKNQNMTLEDVFQFIEAKEAGKRSAGRLLEVQTTNAALSQCRQTKQEAMKNRQPDKGNKCHYCGQYGHANAAPPTIHQIRENLRTMWSPKSSWCDMPTKRKTKSPPKVTPTNLSADAEGAIFGLVVHNIQHHCCYRQNTHRVGPLPLQPP